MQNKKTVFLVLILTLALISTIVLFFKNSESTFPEGSTIGGIDVGDKTEEEAINLLSETIGQWKQEPLQLSTLTGIIRIPTDAIQFDIDSSIHLLKEQIEKPWYLFFKKVEGKQIPLAVTVQFEEDLEQFENAIDVDQTIERIRQTASYLGKSEIEAVQLEIPEESLIAETSWQIPENNHFTDLFVAELNNVTIESGEIFSFLDTVVEQVSHYNEEEGNFIASVLYSVFLKTNVQILERHSQGVIPTYSEAGIEARVSEEEQLDLMVKNTGSTQITIQAEQKNNEVTIRILSTEAEKTYTYRVENEIDVQYPTIKRYNKQLDPDEERIIQNGMDGKRVDVYRISTSNDTDSEHMSRDYYPPTPKIIAVGFRDEETSANDENDASPTMEEDMTDDTDTLENITIGQGDEFVEENTDEIPDSDSIYEQPDIVK
ncbi:VanW family protein [Fervidibacillus albus]|uniref:VanW family protein n=1 Tax=Fervidibacillus albus TaxID=2980026 RepID=A0A9E8LT22_9BACI|nr:VanW family protein [Fervidibacillus albus]WAA08870.1 VanW family protein [Fervidibacillus albus]